MPAANEPFHLRSTHDGQRTQTYSLQQNGAVVQTAPVADLGAVEPGKISFSFPSGLPAGTYEFQVDAVGTGGTASSPVLNETIDVLAPVAPGTPEIVVNP